MALSIVPFCLTLFLVILVANGANGQTQTSTVNFDTSTDLQDNFNDDLSPVFTNVTSGGINNSGAINVPIGSDDLWTTKDGYSLSGAIGDIYKIEAFFKIEVNSGYGGLGFAEADQNTNNSPGYANPGLGATFHGGGGAFHNNGTTTTLSWYSTMGDLVLGNWYKFIFTVEVVGTNTYDLTLDIINSDANGNVGSVFTTQNLSNVVNNDIGNASTIHTYFSSTGSRMSKIDNFSIILEGGSSIIQEGMPVILTSSVNSVTTTTAECGGEVVDENGASVTARGVCWSTVANPTISDNITSDGSGLGSFTSSLTGLSPNTVYYVRAYATNTVGTSYGAEYTFTTDPIPTGPGGVTSNLELWLSSDVGTYSDRVGNTAGSTPVTNGQTVQSWEDQSGVRTNAATDADATLAGPVYRTTSDVNYRPRLDFDGLVGLSFGDDYLFSSGTGMSILTVAKSRTTTTAYPFLYDFGFYEQENHYVILSNGSVTTKGPSNHGAVQASASCTADDVPLIINSNHEFSPSTTNEIFVNGMLASSVNTTLSQITAAEITESPLREGSFGPPTIGVQAKTFSETSRHFEGDIMEFIIYSKDIESIPNERSKIESYLALKYGITLDASGGGTAGDYLNSGGSTIWDASSSSVYHNDVIGLIRDDASNLLQKQSRTHDDSLKVFVSTLAALNEDNGGNISNDLSSLLIGHNAEALYHQGSVEMPPGIDARFEREWKVTNTNFSETFSLEFEWAGLGTFDINDVRLLVDEDGDFSDATILGPSDGLTFSVGSIIVNGISTAHIPANSTRYITIGSVDALATPLPIELGLFEATAFEDEVVVTWETLSERNNDYFVIERKTEQDDWQEIGIVNGAGDSQSKLIYQLRDQQPVIGTSYYRLKQVDFDGAFTYSEIRSVDFQRGEEFLMYPNPTTSKLYLESSRKIDHVELFDIAGRDMADRIQKEKISSSIIELDLSELPQGTYFIKVVNETFIVVKE